MATVLNNHAQRFFFVHNFEHVLQGEGFEIQAVAGVVVGGHGLRVAIDHDGLVTVLAHGQGGVHAAVVKFNALADAVGAATEHHDFLALAGFGLALIFIGGVHVGGIGGKFGRAGVHPLVNRTHPLCMALVTHRLLAAVGEFGQAAIREAFFLQGAHVCRINGVERRGVEFQLNFDDVFNLHQEPRIDLGQGMHLIHAHALGKGVAHIPNAVRPRCTKFFFQDLAVLGFFVHAIHADFQAAQGLLERLLKGATHGHHLTHRLHLGGQSAVGLGEFFKGKARNFGDHVIDAGLETGWGGTARDVVAQFIQGIAHGQFGRHLGNGKTGGLGGQGGGTRHPGVHLDHDHAPIFGVDRKLHIRATGVNANFPQHRQAGVAHDLVFLVGQGLGRRHRDGVARVHAHGVQVFNGTHDDAVVRFVAHHLHLKLFPTQQRLFDQQLIGRRGLQAALANGFKLFSVVGNAPAGAAQGEAGADDGGKAHRLLHHPSLVHRMGNARARRTQTDFGHRIFELEPVFGFVDGLWAGPNQLNLVFVEHPVAPQVKRTVEGCLAAHGWQDGVGALFGDDFFHRLPGDGLDVGHIGCGRVGHDRGRVAVDQDDLEPLFAQGFAGLNARIVKLTGLPNDDGACANDEDAFDVCALRHADLSVYRCEGTQPRWGFEKRCAGAGCSCARVHQTDKAVEQIGDVVRARRSFWVALETKCGLVGAGQTLHSAIKQAHVRGAQMCR